MFDTYWQIELNTNTRKLCKWPRELPEEQAHRILDSLNQDAAIYGCVYVLREKSSANYAVQELSII